MRTKLFFISVALVIGVLGYMGIAKALECGADPGTCADGIPSAADFNDTTQQWEWTCYGGGNSISCYDTDDPDPVPPPICGDGAVEGTEECDGYNLNGGTCFKLTGVVGGDLRCNADCTYDISGCLGADQLDTPPDDGVIGDEDIVPPPDNGEVDDARGGIPTHNDTQFCADGSKSFSEWVTVTIKFDSGLCGGCAAGYDWDPESGEAGNLISARDTDGDGVYEFGDSPCADGFEAMNQTTSSNPEGETILCWDCAARDNTGQVTAVVDGCCARVDEFGSVPMTEGPACAGDETAVVDMTGAFPASQFCASGIPTLSSSDYWYYCKPDLTNDPVGTFGYCNDITWTCSEGAEASASCTGQAYVPYDYKDAIGFTTRYPINIK